MASTAPVVVALLLWAITRSPIALMFAAIGPIVAVGGIVDGVRSRRTVRRRQRAAHRTAVAVVRGRLAAARAEERRTAWLAHPSAMDRFLGGADDPARWGRDAPGPVTAGSGTTMSAVELIDGAGQRETGPEVDAEREALLEESASIDDMPVVVDAGGGIGVVGDDSLVRTVMRGLVLQLCDDVPPRRLRLVAVPERHWDWAAALPHAAQSDADAPGLLVVHRGADPAQPQPAPPASDHHGRTGVVIAGAATVRALPPGCTTIIRVRSAVDAEVVRGQVAHYGPFVPELVGEEHAAAHAAMLASLAVRERSPTVPSLVRLADLARVTAGPLGCAIGRGSHGDVVVDLVADGPHAVVGGTTGSGKSELLITWIAAMASRTTPKEFAFLLVDFKGGATGAVLAELPHCLGVVTDLDGPLSDRVLQSLDAEIRRRERLVAAAGVRSIDELPPGRLPRLVVVIDELAALLASAPDLHALLADVAARGRSLGMHLILCTQRPAGVIREALLANCGL
ncbi:MAG: FtsK/SpoIIIE domain-containing protein, partial [Leifsonia sp.]